MIRINDFSMVAILLVILHIALIPAAYAESYTYDNTGRLTSVTYDDETSISYTYDKNGNILNMAVAGQPDTTPPVITLIDSGSVTVANGASYTDAGATASDDVDGDISANIVTVNPVNTAVSAVYTVTYDVADAAGNNATQVTRSVTVSEPQIYVRKSPGGGCAINQSASFDPTLILMTLISLVYMRRRRTVIGKE